MILGTIRRSITVTALTASMSCILLTSSGCFSPWKDSTGESSATVSKPAPPVITRPMTSHTVVSGDSLWLLARQYGCSIAEIRAANGLEGDLIQVGQVLAVPAKVDSEVAPAGPELITPGAGTQPISGAPAIPPSLTLGDQANSAEEFRPVSAPRNPEVRYFSDGSTPDASPSGTVSNELNVPSIVP